MSDPILSVRDLRSGYGRSQVLFGVSLSVPAQGAVAVLGRNGAGKTTLLKTLAGEIRPMGGAVVFDGADCADEGTERRVRRGLGYVPQDQAVFTSLTVRENLMLGAMADPSGDGFDMALDFFPKLAGRLGQQAGTLSGGERKMLAIGRAILGKPRLLMLDEPTEGVWIGVIEEISERLIELSKEIALIVVEQHVALALQVASHAYVMGRGDIVLEGATAEIRDNPDLARHLAP
ncbi:ABC transporter ATP-binding protein [Pikeienuella sp. HZG-20]|uniref:ABC transporter ATP-binding protein n=1 Tax=Paludibacillus litoralis TaxID=3133267 RepID=UPI0030EF0F87